MCGIVGYMGSRPALPIILDGLKRLEYRGYDSSGVALINGVEPFFMRKSVAKLDVLASSVDNGSAGTIGIGHTRWATHGKPTVANAHPHIDCSGDIAVVHNGIIENHAALRDELKAKGHAFRSQTDTEVIPHLIESFMASGSGFADAVRLGAGKLAGAQAITVISRKEPGKMVGVRIGHAGGLVVGYGNGEHLLASDLSALVAHVTAITYLADREMAVITREGARFQYLDGNELHKARTAIQQDPVSVAKGQCQHFMLKEIMEQPETLISVLRDRLDVANGRVSLSGFPFSSEQIRDFQRVVLVGMGTSYNAALVGRLMIESLAGIPAQTENASEFRYRDPLFDNKTLMISVGQSGETADTLAAMVDAKQRGIPQVTVCNVAGSEATRVADYTMLIQAGPEIGVASTKTLTGSMLCLYLLSIFIGEARGALDKARVARLVEEVVRLPKLMGQVVTKPDYEPLARRYSHSSNFLLLGRGVNYPTALEGALKMKEISYIHAEGYQAAEMKHGPIALIDGDMPVLAIAPKDMMYDKMLGNIEEVKARDGHVIALVTEGDQLAAAKADDVLTVPPVSYLLSPILAVGPLQLLAYHIAVRRGCDVDQPRNLAKTVTVE